jgi:two-component system phosphate regulon response regulator PhoB
MSRPRILIIEDERALTKVLAYNLEREGYEPVIAHDGQEGLRKAQTLPTDLIILDLMLPSLNGLDVCRQLRAGEKTRDIPIVMLTAKSEETDQIVGFSLGADDYVTKPFSVKVLLQRIKALRRRAESGPETADVIEHLGVRVDRGSHRASVNRHILDLTPTEFRLLECFLRHPGRAFSRNQLMDVAIGEHAVVSERTIDVHVKSLRKKLGEAGELLETVRGPCTDRPLTPNPSPPQGRGEKKAAPCDRFQAALQ